MSKYHNKKLTVDGQTFDSGKEYRRFRELCLLERAGQIAGLQRQVKFELLPAQRIDGKVVERACSYVADFVYTEDGQQVVEDAKGMRTQEYRLKRKLMLYIHGIRIRET